MASAVFEGTSLVNMYVRGCWVNGIRRLIINRRGDEEEFFEIRTEWSDRNVLYLHRSYSDLGRLFKRLLDSFPEDRPELSQSPLLQGLITIKESHDIEARLNEVEKLLNNIINMPWKYSRSEVVLTFFERSPLDQVLKNDNVHKIQPSFQSPVKISAFKTVRPFGERSHLGPNPIQLSSADAAMPIGNMLHPVVDGHLQRSPQKIMRSNGFCLANTETIVIDHNIPNGKEKHLEVDSAEHLLLHTVVGGALSKDLCLWKDLGSQLSNRDSVILMQPHSTTRFENVSDFTSELEDSDDPAAYVTNLSYYHLVPFETDILD